MNAPTSAQDIRGMKPDEVEKWIHVRLKSLAEERSIVIKYAIESGSRAWGFHNPLSDYDIRFVYCHKMSKYLSIDGLKKDTILTTTLDIFDFHGWDIVKMLQLMRKSNPSALEWSQMYDSNVYLDTGGARHMLKEIAPKCYHQKTLIGHYYGMAKKEYRKHIQRNSQVPYKKYLYIMRPMLCCAYVLKYNQIPPIELRELLNAYPEIVEGRHSLVGVNDHIYDLDEIDDITDTWFGQVFDPSDRLEIPSRLDKIAYYTRHPDYIRDNRHTKQYGSRIPELDKYIESELEFFEKWMKESPKVERNDVTHELNRIFIETLNSANAIDMVKPVLSITSLV